MILIALPLLAVGCNAAECKQADACCAAANESLGEPACTPDLDLHDMSDGKSCAIMTDFLRAQLRDRNKEIPAACK